MEPIKPLRKTAWYLVYMATDLMSKEGHFLAGAGTSGYFGDLKKRGFTYGY